MVALLLLALPVVSGAAAADGPSWACASSHALTSLTYRVDGGPAIAVTRSLGQLRPGSTVSVSFTVASGCTGLVVSLAAYAAPAADFDPATAPAQRLLASDSRRVVPGPVTLQVVVPDCFFQVDLVRGAVLPQLGPAGTTSYYSAQRRLIAAGNGGRSDCGPAPPPRPSPGVFVPTPPGVPPPPLTTTSESSPAATPTASANPLPSASPSALPSVPPTPTASPVRGQGGGSGSPSGGGPRGVFLPFTGLDLSSQLALVLVLTGAGAWLVGAARTRHGPTGF